MTDKETELFERRPVFSAVLALVVPTVISQLVHVVYNMADTFFVGQTGDPNQVAAAGLCMPLFIFLTGIANLFGIGGSSLISRSLGAGNEDRARRTASFSLWSAVCLAFVYGIAIYVLRPVVLPAVGANEGTYDHCSRYLFWTVCIGAVPTVMNPCLAHLVRAEGHAKKASFGMVLGAGLNIVLDPVFILALDLQVAGAAMATMISNVIASIYFITDLVRRQDTTVVKLNPKYYSLGDGVPKEVLLTGLPSAFMNLMGTLSNITLNKLMSTYSNAAIAGVGIAKKVDMMIFGISTGISQGVVPLIGYNYAAKNFDRMKKSIKTTFILSLSVAVVCTVFLLTCAHPIVRAFISDAETVGYGQKFQRIICCAGPCISVTLICITIFQAVGKKVQPLILSMLRKGGLDIPIMLIMNALVGVYGIVWATPIADFTGMVASLLMFIPFWKSLKLED